MLTNPLYLLKTIDTNNKHPNCEAFAGPYQCNEVQFLWNAVIEAQRQKHGVYFSRSEKGTKTSVTIHLIRSQFAVENQHPREIFETMSQQDCELKNVEKNFHRRLRSIAAAIKYCTETCASGHQPVFIEDLDQGGLIAGFIRQKYDSTKKREKKGPKGGKSKKTKNEETNL